MITNGFSQKADATGTAHEMHVVCRRILDSHLSPAQLGKLGENFASSLLLQRGWHILARNYRTRFGEIDIISRDKNEQLVFTEVKTRRSVRYGMPEEAVSPAKQRHLRLASYQWLRENPRIPRISRIPRPTAPSQPPDQPLSPRFDVISVLVSPDHIRARLIKGAF